MASGIPRPLHATHSITLRSQLAVQYSRGMQQRQQLDPLTSQ